MKDYIVNYFEKLANLELLDNLKIAILLESLPKILTIFSFQHY